MSYIHNFDGFLIQEASEPNDWIEKWQQIPEGKLLKLMGWRDVTDPRDKRKISLYCDGIGCKNLTKGGYVRNPNVQGYLFSGIGLKSLLAYIVQRYAKKQIPGIPEDSLLALCRENPELTEYLFETPDIQRRIESAINKSNPKAESGLSPSQIKWLDSCTSGTWRYNTETQRIDVNGNFRIPSSRETDTPVKNPRGFRGIKFGSITGSFTCSGIGLRSLEGSPRNVGQTFDCENNSLETLEGGPEAVTVHYFCGGNLLTDLKGSPKKVGGFRCSGNRLETLLGGPEESHLMFDCSNNNLKSLVGGPQGEVITYRCLRNKLISLKGAPDQAETFDCQQNKLTSLEHCPSGIRILNCSSNELTSLAHCPRGVQILDFHYNDLKSLAELPPGDYKEIDCRANPDLELGQLPGIPVEAISADENTLVTSLKTLLGAKIPMPDLYGQRLSDAQIVLEKLKRKVDGIKFFDDFPETKMIEQEPDILPYVWEAFKTKGQEISDNVLERLWVTIPNEFPPLGEELERRGFDMKKLNLLRKVHHRSKSGLI